MSGGGFIALHRGERSATLLRDPFAFAVLTLICMRARWQADDPEISLRHGEALIGAYDVERTLCMSRKQYRCALDRLVAAGQVTITPTRGLGTVAKVGPECVFSVSLGRRAMVGAKVGAMKRAKDFPYENGQRGAMKRAMIGASEGPLSNNNNTPARVQNRSPSGETYFESREQGEEEEARYEAPSGHEPKPGRDQPDERGANIPFASPPPKTVRSVHDEPPGWREWLLEHRPDAVFLNPDSQWYATSWAAIPKFSRSEILKLMAKHAAA
jgi:hypothetical protein